ncbi:hypothetical protein AAFF_G00387800 [Aldrovandia affinis]|uniref:CAP-Gly domain-containing protein n=1 Tax=Aldrovandia affinis TaxID=143900 RepID=A0AAD7SET9_9TELE|nr:hypothetical protein AAFF_G00387800 [Aldrovandia affinis]
MEETQAEMLNGDDSPEGEMTKEDVPESSEGDSVLGRHRSLSPDADRPVVHQVASAPMPSDCEFSFFDPSDPQCREVLLDPQTTVSELFAVLRQWVPQVQKNISLIGNEILKRGCGVNDRDGLTDMSLLHYSCKAGAPGIGDAETAASFARQLLCLGAVPGLRSRWTNMNALHYAAYFDVPPLIHVVLQASQPGEVDATCSDFDFGTALHIAASNLCVSAAKCLLELGANPAFRNEKGQCPADVVPEPLDMPLEMADAAAQAKELRALLKDALPQPCAPILPRPTGVLSDKARAQLCTMGIRMGDRVVIAGQKVGTLRFCGSTDFAGGQWAGVELDDPEGKNDGSVAGVQYFSCRPKHGIFAPLSKISKPSERRRTAPLRSSTPVRPARLDLTRVTSKVNTGKGTPSVKKTTAKLKESSAPIEGADDPPEGNTGALSRSCSSSSSSLDSRHGPPSRPRPLPRQRPPARIRRERAPPSSKTTPPISQTPTGPRTRTPSASSSVCEGSEVRLGERVLVVGQRTGVVRFYGKTSFAPGFWLGIELDKPSGKNDGSVGGVQYFSCPAKHGVFAPPSRVQRIHGSLDCLSELTSSRLNRSFAGEDPTQLQQHLHHLCPQGAKPQEPSEQEPSDSAETQVEHRELGRGAGGTGSTGTGSSGSDGAVKLHLGMQVLLTSANEMGVIRYLGTADFAPGLWLGLDLRGAKGKNDGSVGGRRYFSCRAGHGVLVRPSRVTYRGINGARLHFSVARVCLRIVNGKTKRRKPGLRVRDWDGWKTKTDGQKSQCSPYHCYTSDALREYARALFSSDAVPRGMNLVSCRVAVPMVTSSGRLSSVTPARPTDGPAREPAQSEEWDGGEGGRIQQEGSGGAWWRRRGQQGSAVALLLLLLLLLLLVEELQLLLLLELLVLKLQPHGSGRLPHSPPRVLLALPRDPPPGLPLPLLLLLLLQEPGAVRGVPQVRGLPVATLLIDGLALGEAQVDVAPLGGGFGGGRRLCRVRLWLWLWLWVWLPSGGGQWLGGVAGLRGRLLLSLALLGRGGLLSALRWHQQGGGGGGVVRVQGHALLLLRDGPVLHRQGHCHHVRILEGGQARDTRGAPEDTRVLGSVRGRLFALHSSGWAELPLRRTVPLAHLAQLDCGCPIDQRSRCVCDEAVSRQFLAAISLQGAREDSISTGKGASFPLGPSWDRGARERGAGRGKEENIHHSLALPALLALLSVLSVLAATRDVPSHVQKVHHAQTGGLLLDRQTDRQAERGQRLPRRRDSTHTRNLSNLIHPPRSPGVDVVVAGGLWNCQSAVRKADFISAQASLLSLQFLALTETWITPQNTATPAALSAAYTFSHTPRPSGPLGSFLDEMDALLSAFPEDGTPVLLLGDFNLQLESSQASAFLPLLQSFDFTMAESPSTHKAGNQLDLVFTRNCASPNITSIAMDILPFVSNVINSSLSSGSVPSSSNALRLSSSSKTSLNPAVISNYRPNDLLDPNQSGFRAGHSTETALLAVTEALHAAKSRSLSSVLLLSTCRRHSTPWTTGSCSSLAEMGISGSVLTWFESYLADGEGLPMIDASITVEGSIVSPPQSARSLGVTLDNQLCFSSHIAAITRTCRFSLHNIRRIRPFLTQEATQLLVQALVISRLDYCNSCWQAFRPHASDSSHWCWLFKPENKRYCCLLWLWRHIRAHLNPSSDNQLISYWCARKLMANLAK